MKKDKKFLSELESNLEGVSSKNKKKIIDKYDNLIKEGKEQNKKITVILKELGKPKEVAEKEKALLGKEPALLRLKESAKKAKKNASDSLRKLKKSVKKKLKNKDKKKAAIKNEVDKEKIKVEKTKIKEEKKKLKEEKNLERKKIKEEKKKLKLEKKELKKKIKEEKNKDKEKKDKEKKPIFGFLTKDISLKKKEKEKESIIVPYEGEKTTPSEIVSDIKEEIKEEISEVSEIVSENRLFESKKDRRKRIILKTLGVIITIILMFIWLWVAIVFIASLFAYLDGIKFIGICIALGGLTFLILWIIVMVNRLVFRKKHNLVLNLVVSFICLGVIAFGVVHGVKQISEIKTVKDVSVKYSLTTKLSTYNLPSEPNEKFIIEFNSNYKTQYTMKYDNTLKNKFRIEVKYYECYYDYYMKQTSNSTYISLKLDDRDRLSVYIDDLKEGLVFDNDELARYSVRITVNPKDAQRLVIYN